MKLTERLLEHYEDALKIYPKERILGIFLQGSQNYHLDIPGSDVDTKCVLVPSIEDICYNRKPISTTHIRENDEHIDFKDVRLMIQTFKKQNLNFLEILFTDHYILNEQYADLWNKLIYAREAIARYNEIACIKSMKGIATEKYHALEHRYPSRVHVIDKFGYDPKQLHHLVRIKDFLINYATCQLPFKCCMIPTENRDLLLDIKLGKYSLDYAREMAKEALSYIEALKEDFCLKHEERPDVNIGLLLDEVQADIIKRALAIDLGVNKQ